jgi:diguanylate cyclase (GGDEF)-like protein
VSTRSVESEQEIERMSEEAEGRFRRIFYASTLLSVLIVLYIVFVSRYVVPLKVRVPLAPLLLWSLIVTCYAFYSLWELTRERTAKLKELSEHDSITSAYTETYLRHRLSEVIDAPASAGGRGAFVYIRFSGIKKANLQYGYTVRNVVLRDLVDDGQEEVPEDGFIARLGGLEFVVLLPGCDEEEAHAWMKVLSRGVGDYRMDLGERGAISELGVKLGLALYPSEGHSVEDLARAARNKAVGGEEA